MTVHKCPVCSRVCPANEFHAYGRHEDCAMTDATVSVSRQVPSNIMANRRGPYKKRTTRDNPVTVKTS